MTTPTSGAKRAYPKEKDNFQDVPYEGVIETWFAQYQESNNVIIHDIEECKKTSEAIYERLKPQGVNTLVTEPIKINGKMVGFYGVDNPPEEKLHEISNADKYDRVYDLFYDKTAQ